MLRYKFWMYCVILAWLSACSSNPASKSHDSRSTTNASAQTEAADQAYANAPRSQSAKGSERLGTQWGDDVDSHVTSVDLRRVSEAPIAQTSVRYADKRYSGRAVNSISLAAGKIEFSVESDRGRNLSLYRDGSQYYLKGEAGQAYRLVYRNNSNNTYEIVSSVDGLDVLNGSRASRYNTGYVLRPKERLVIEGFRKSNSAVASFIFSKPDDSYAANTPNGDVNNTGIIGTAIYELYDPQARKRPVSRSSDGLDAFPADEGYAPAPR